MPDGGNIPEGAAFCCPAWTHIRNSDLNSTFSRRVIFNSNFLIRIVSTIDDIKMTHFLHPHPTPSRIFPPKENAAFLV